LNKKDLPPDMRKYWGSVAKWIGPYNSIGESFKSWLPAKEKKKR